MKLTSEQAQQAWNDYKEFTESLGGRYKDAAERELIQRTAKQAFLMGYAMGEAAKKTTTKQPLTVMTVKPTVEKRTKRTRTEKQIREDARLVASIMQRHNKPMYLSEIYDAVNAAGADWYKRSASGHMITVMNIYPTIKKLERGLYQYVQ